MQKCDTKEKKSSDSKVTCDGKVWKKQDSKVVLGDVDCEEGITTFDAALVKGYVKNGGKFSDTSLCENSLINANVNCENGITTFDAVLIKKKVKDPTFIFKGCSN